MTWTKQRMCCLGAFVDLSAQRRITRSRIQQTPGPILQTPHAAAEQVRLPVALHCAAVRTGLDPTGCGTALRGNAPGGGRYWFPAAGHRCLRGCQWAVLIDVRHERHSQRGFGDRGAALTQMWRSRGQRRGPGDDGGADPATAVHRGHVQRMQPPRQGARWTNQRIILFPESRTAARCGDDANSVAHTHVGDGQFGNALVAQAGNCGQDEQGAIPPADPSVRRQAAQCRLHGVFRDVLCRRGCRFIIEIEMLPEERRKCLRRRVSCSHVVPRLAVVLANAHRSCRWIEPADWSVHCPQRLELTSFVFY